MTATSSREEQRARVLATAADLFAANGFDDVTMAEIAEAAGVARATVFNYFQSKHALVEAITEGVIAFYRAMLDLALVDEETPAPELIRSLFEQMAHGIEADRRFFRGVFREIARVQLGLEEGSLAQQTSDDVQARLRQLIERGQSRDQISTAISADDLTAAMHSLTNGTITNWLYIDPTESLVARMQAAAEVLLSPIELNRTRRPRRAPHLTPPRRHEGVTS
jgi:AcrR family transcriptional regulator